MSQPQRLPDDTPYIGHVTYCSWELDESQYEARLGFSGDGSLPVIVRHIPSHTEQTYYAIFNYPNWVHYPEPSLFYVDLLGNRVTHPSILAVIRRDTRQDASPNTGLDKPLHSPL